MSVVLHFMTVTLNHMQLKQPQILVQSEYFPSEPAWGFLHSPVLRRRDWRASYYYWSSL